MLRAVDRDRQTPNGLHAPRLKYDLLYARVIAVPVKTSQTKRVSVTVRRDANGSYWLALPQNADATEDDNDAYFSVPQ